MTAQEQRFGANEWLVDEIYQQYLADKNAVDPAWWDFFDDYSPADGSALKAAIEHANGSTPASPATPATPAAATPVVATSVETGEAIPLKGPAARIVGNMEASLAVPTATSVRGIPAKLLADNRVVINNHLARGRGGKVSFTHLIGYAVVRALASVPEMNAFFLEVDGKPAVMRPHGVNLGIAIDLTKSDGTRQLLVPNIKGAQDLDFAQFWASYEDVVRRARTGALTADDFAGTTLSLTNPGTLGTEHSVPRLLQGQGCIIGVGAMEYPAEWQGASEETLVRNAVSKTL
ncbi:MAG: 2-oxo acid dehydrogenase subunit E2, partial [Actinomycetota bacterium]